MLLSAQVLGLTNYSHWDKAAEMRSCMVKHEDIAGGQAQQELMAESESAHQLQCDAWLGKLSEFELHTRRSV